VANSASLARGKFRNSATASVTREGSNVVKKAKIYQEYKLNAREVCVLTRLQHFQWAPKLLKSTKDTITMSNVGQPVTKDTLPPDYATQFRNILTDMESVGVQHNDIIFPCSTTSFRKHEVMVHEGRLSLIDFNWATIDRGVPCNVSTRLFTPGWTPCKDLTMMSVLDGMALEPALPWNQILRARRSSKLNLRG
jgi:predicted Ser/Thr protein kinase